MSTTIGSVNELVRLIQVQMAPRTPGSRTERRAGAARGTAGSRYAHEQLATLIETRVRAIDRDDPQRGRKAFRVFLEAVLVSQFGDGVLGDPHFFRLLDEVHDAMAGDPACSAMMEQAIAHLLQQEGA